MRANVTFFAPSVKANTSSHAFFCLIYLLRRPEAPFYAAQVTIYVPNPTLVLEEEEGYYVQKWAEDGQNQPNVDFSGEKI